MRIMEDIKVSVIMPSYNVAAYIEETIRSALAQTLGAVELICVDAGSTDGTRRIISELKAENDESPRPVPMRVIESDKKSYGHQVNLGIEASRGEYVAILETDDVAAPHMYESLYKLAKERKAEVVKSTYFDYFGNAKGSVNIGGGREIPGRASVSKLAAIKPPRDTVKKYEGTRISYEIFPKKIFRIDQCPELVLHHPSVWSAIYSREYLDRYNIRFPEIPGAGWADNPFMIKSLIYASRIAYTPQAFYYYRKDNPGSSTSMKDCRMPFERIRDMRDVLEEYIGAASARAGKGLSEIDRRDQIRDRMYDIARAIDHRALRYAADALASPAFSEEDAEFIRDCLLPIPRDYLQDEHVTADELAAYNRLTGARVRFSSGHRRRALAYKLKYGFSYFFNKRYY